jgi:glutathione S-transferase
MLGIAHEYRDVDLRVPLSERRSDFRAASRFGEVPVFVENGVPLAQSNAILVHLARGTGRLGGGENLDAVIEWLFWEANRVGFSVANLRHALKFAPDTPEPVVAWLRARAVSDLTRLNSELAAKRFLLGAECTVADIACCAYLFWSEQAKLDLSEWPHVALWLDRIRGLRGWAAPYDLLRSES